jgi:D-glycero-D-manno-heptose 1,7-bisphosphate phosphatase
MQRKAVFLDRDGVLNRPIVRNGKPYSPSDLSELEIIETSAQACRKLTAFGYLLIGVTNQPDIARGKMTREIVDQINTTVAEEMGLDEMHLCPHDDADECACRKPKPGMLLEAARSFDIDLSSSIMVGDRWKDVEAGVAAGCRTVFVDYDYEEPKPTHVDHVCQSLLGAIPWITGVSPNP